LDDYRSAANALEQGNFYREAAILYLEHLKDKKAAATCYEKGGLLLEAIALYKELKLFEQAGDLYMTLEQVPEAIECYKEEAARYQRDSKFIAAAQLYYHKIGDKDEAKRILLDAWHSDPKYVDCLKKYLIYINQDEADDMKVCIQALYESLPHANHASFLELIAELPEVYPQADLLETVREIGYCLLSGEIAEGKHTRLSLLGKFLPEDRLILSETSRFMRSRQKRIQRKPYAKRFQLERKTQWSIITSKYDQFLALGREGEQLVIARGNWFGDVVYQKWPESDDINMLLDDPQTNQIWAFGKFVNFPVTLHFERNLFFKQQLVLRRPNFEVEEQVSIGVKEANELRVLKSKHGVAMLQHISANDELLASYACQTTDQAHIMLQAREQLFPIFHHLGWNYTIANQMLMLIRDDGVSSIYPLEERAIKMKVLAEAEALHILLHTEKGCC